jgi:hypothetical protein
MAELVSWCVESGIRVHVSGCVVEVVIVLIYTTTQFCIASSRYNSLNNNIAGIAKQTSVDDRELRARPDTNAIT